MANVTPDALVARIATLTTSSRATWFTYLGILLFVAVTLLNVRHTDFFDSGSGIQLPLVGVTVPVTIFIMASAFLVAAINGYLHVVLEEFWSAVADAPAVLSDGRPLSSALPPWLVTGFALHLRARINTEAQAPIQASPLGLLGALVSFALLFLAGPVLLAWLWLVSQPAHEAWLTLIVGLLATIAAAISAMSFSTLIRRVQHRAPSRARLLGMVTLAFGGLVACVSLARTEWDPMGALVTRHPEDPGTFERTAQWFRPAIADLRFARITQLSRDWVPHVEAVADFGRDWCPDQADPVACRAIGLADPAFLGAYRDRRDRALAIFEKPDLSDRHMDHADFVFAFLPGVWMNRAKLRRADFHSAVIEGVVAQRADLTNAVLASADAAMADFRRATLNGANMYQIAAPGADFVSARMRSADLTDANLSHALLNVADMTSANLNGANLRGALFHRATLVDTDLREATLTGADLVQTDLSGAWLGRTRIGRATISNAQFVGAYLTGVLLDHDGAFWFGRTDFTNAQLEWVAFRNADMSQAIFDGPDALAYTFGDGSVTLPEGMPRPCHWVEDVLADTAFYAHWRGLTLATNLQPFWVGMADSAFDDVVPTPPPAECDFPDMDPETGFAWSRAFYARQTDP
ncbi:pentapeptide repeat-containing protein [Tropicimonas sp. S265A]|uniref:pentapeptide repeat-containing protein n=1 Tax=Tropicimonas sp. S265A TaxID=3415134 RepID=UPI003C7DEF20